MSAAYDALGGLSVILGSPAEIHVYDEQGQHVGLTKSGTVEADIPDSCYGKIRHFTVVWLPDATAGYEVIVEGEEEGKFDLELRAEKGTGVKTVKYHGVPVGSDTVTHVSVQQGGDFVMAVDEDGDGIFESLKPPDEVLIDSDGDGVGDKADFCPAHWLQRQ